MERSNKAVQGDETTIQYHDAVITTEKIFYPKDIYGLIGALGNALIGYPRTNRIIVRPEQKYVEIREDHNIYILTGDDINKSPICQRCSLHYLKDIENTRL
ncbi:MAG: hypothetical protein HZB67_01135 [Candidatus Aenigmarchaeota archaeon]|nr:hypothetical protein [Candidatus Aenigmarchaeota archaeon]